MNVAATRISQFGTTIFAQMSQLAAQTNSINLGQGFPDVDGPSWVKDAVAEAMRSGVNQYQLGVGRAELRDAIARHQQRLYGLNLDPESEVAVTTGATEAIAATVLGLVDPGEEVVVLEPYFDSYVATLSMAGATRIPVTLQAPDFRLPIDALRSAVGSNTKIMLINSPHNPTGTVLDRDELQVIADLAIKHDVVVVTDEVYEHLTFGVEHVPLASLPGMAERTLTISSAGKSFSLTGWKVGWATGPEHLIRAMMLAKQFLTYSSGAPFQPAIAQALDRAEEITGPLREELLARRDQLCAGLADLGFEVYWPDGTYFVTTDVRPLGYIDGNEFCLTLPERCGVVAIPAAALYDNQAAGRSLVRWAFCKHESVLDDALKRLRALN